MSKQVFQFISVLVFCLCFASCSHKSLKFQDKLVGKYEKISKTINYEALELGAGSTFHYSFYNNPMKCHGEANGKIRFKGRRMFLYSDMDSIIMEEQQVDTGYHIKVVEPSGEPLFGATCIAIQNENIITGVVTDFDGRCMLDVSNIDKVIIEQVGFGTVSIDMNEYQSNAFTIVLDESFRSRVFRGEELKVRKHHIEIIYNAYITKYAKVEGNNK